MSRVLVYVEGQTEEAFVNRLLAPHLAHQGVFITPVLAITRRTRAGETSRGGIVSYGQVRRDVLRLLSDRSAAMVTTMLDFYGLPEDFPGQTALSGGPPRERVEAVEAAVSAAIGDRRFIPFLTLHEFEALLFAQPEHFGDVFGEDAGAGISDAAGGLPPEEIDEGRDSHPAARIMRRIPRYRKPLHGPLLAERAGLAAIRARCPHFDGWVSRLETL